jgi:hypothetical protein
LANGINKPLITLTKTTMKGAYNKEHWKYYMTFKDENKTVIHQRTLKNFVCMQ